MFNKLQRSSSSSLQLLGHGSLGLCAGAPLGSSAVLRLSGENADETVRLQTPELIAAAVSRALGLPVRQDTGIPVLPLTLDESLPLTGASVFPTVKWGV